MNMQHNADIKLPNRRMEAWKWTDIGKYVAGKNLAGQNSASMPAFDLSAGLEVSSENLPAIDTPMSQLAGKFVPKTIIITVPKGSDEKLSITNMPAGHARVIIRLEENASIITTEIYESTNACFSNLDLGFELAKGARLVREVYQNDHEQTSRIVTSRINAWAGVDIEQYVLGFGGGIARLETRFAFMGKDINLHINGASLLAGRRHLDQTSYVDLGAEAAKVRQSVKSVVTDNAVSVFQGKFHVRRPAQLTDANMRHDGIMLSDSAQVRAKPELEIYADNVACAHGNTIGTLDESALFYMRSRGIPLSQARAILLQAFIGEGFENNPLFMSKISKWLEQNS